MNMKRPSFFLVLWTVGACLVFSAARAQDWESGKFQERVACLNRPGQSYALYLPSSFDPEKKWPVLFLFDAAARGAAGVEAFRTAAERYGWILVGSNNSKNGPLEACAEAALAVWADARRRLPVDEQRVYAGGFSGGARIASIFPRLAGRGIAGVIGCGAGLQSGLKPGELGAGAYFGLTGLSDFNYGEMKKLDLAFDPSGIPHRFFFFEGRHDWPDPATCLRAVGWLEVTAMKAGLRPEDEALADEVIGRELEEALSFEKGGRVFWAADRLEAAGRLAEGLRDIPGHEARIDDLRSRKEYAQFLAAERKRDQRSEDFRSRFGRAFGPVESGALSGRDAVDAALRVMGIPFLKKDAKIKKTLEDRSLASRLLFDFLYNAQARASELYGRGDLDRAAVYFDLAIEACEEGLPWENFLLYNRACVAALMGDKKRALDFLEAAVDKGLSNAGLLETDKDLESIRDTDRFREIMDKARRSSRSLPPPG